MRRIVTLLVFAFLSIKSFSQDCPLDDVTWEIQPVDVALCFGNQFVFEGQIETGVEYYYQWYKNGSTIGGVEFLDEANFEIPFSSDFDAGFYEVRGYLGHPDTSECFSAEDVYVFVIEGIEIQSFNIEDVLEGNSTQLEIVVTGSEEFLGFQYVWYHDNIIVQNGTSNILQIDGVLDDRGEYYVTIEGLCGIVSSETKFLDIITGIEDKVLYNNKEVKEVYNTMGQEVSLETANQSIIVKYTDGTSERIYNLR